MRDGSIGPERVASYYVHDPYDIMGIEGYEEDDGLFDDPRPKTMVHFRNGSVIFVVGRAHQTQKKVLRYIEQDEEETDRRNKMGL